MLNALKGKRILVTGVTGQVGGALVKVLSGHCELLSAARSGADIELDLGNSAQIISTMTALKPDIVINAAAYTQVDKAEDEPEIARAINATAPAIFAEQCQRLGSTLIHYSTDYVFSGQGDKPLLEKDPVSPINVYGKTKLEGEQAIQAIGCHHLIFRTCWVYDAEGKNFLNTMLQLARSRPVLQVVNDQFGTPTSAQFIAQITSTVLEQCFSTTPLHTQNRNRVYHLTGLGYTSWFEFAQNIISTAKQYEELATTEIVAVNSDAFPTKAKRPAWSVLSTDKIVQNFNVNLSSWKDLLNQCLQFKYR